ncbi:Anti-sigma-K factor rskA [Paenibacillus sp. 1_12]|uniref:anti-sigma factor domain-containing protein n=1 Tax=Paenibacillus sp. 1_12 TaxID=1566278 RepID=UPI0008E4A591|nr:anti-sigma factor [Paenibacillus sp. 1_12]SFL49637.1 Anti-sigma-K factor rskA [Paenibacillus sp. 1_12]
MSEKINDCDQVFPFFLKELSPEASNAFALHLAACPQCAEELRNLQQVWQALPYEMEEIEIPDSVKGHMFDNIMQNVLEHERQEGMERSDAPLISAAPQMAAEEPPKLIQTGRKAGRWSFVAAAVLYIAIGASIGWGLKDYGDSRSSGSPNTSLPEVQPAQVVKQFILKAFDPSMPEATGKCFIKQQGDAKQLVLQVNGLNKNTGDWAYQVWFVKEGVRYNGGTFRVNEKGDGVLTYDLTPAESTFETLGITLEPDAQGTKPRGKKVLGT